MSRGPNEESVERGERDGLNQTPLLSLVRGTLGIDAWILRSGDRQ